MSADTVEATIGRQIPTVDDQLEAAGVTFEPKARAAIEQAAAAVAALDPGLRPDVRERRAAELRDAALEQAAAEYERAIRDELRPIDQQIGTLRNELGGTTIPTREYELPEAASKRAERERREAARLREAPIDLAFVAASQDAGAIADAALDALASDLTPRASRRVAQLAIERLRTLRTAQQAGTRAYDDVSQQLRAVEDAHRAYVAKHPTGRERLAALEQRRAATIHGRRSTFDLLKKRYGYNSRRGLSID